MQLHSLTRITGKKEKRVGRGGKRGKTSGRGGKGQTARAGARIRPEWRDTIKKLPKRRGFGKNRARTVVASRPRPFPVSLASLASVFPDGARITPRVLLDKDLVKKKDNRIPPVKILGSHTLVKKFIVEGCAVSIVARASIEKAGGTVI